MQDDDDKCDDDSDTVKKRVRPEGRQKKFLANTEFHWNLVSLSHQDYDFNYLMIPFIFTGKLAPEKLELHAIYIFCRISLQILKVYFI
jgi:hypothetical protein